VIFGILILEEAIVLFTKWSKSAVPVMSLLLVFIFTLTANVVFEPTVAWADTSEASQAAKGKLSGAVDSAGGFFSGIMSWITSVTDAVNKMWGMENGTGVAKVVNGIFYLLLFVGVAFGGKMVFNIIKDSVGGKVDERYERPSFRKK
jgi:uncharacterized BrkB/YihY/UPF0761 family membrane protein